MQVQADPDISDISENSPLTLSICIAVSFPASMGTLSPVNDFFRRSEMHFSRLNPSLTSQNVPHFRLARAGPFHVFSA